MTSHLSAMSARSFTEAEYASIIAHLAAYGRARDRLLIIAGCATGYRIQELCSLRWGQVRDPATGDIVREITVARRDLRGGRGLWHRSVKGRRLPLSETIRNAFREYLAELGSVTPDQAVFATCRCEKGVAMHRSQAWRIIRDAATDAGVSLARISTHTLRKTFVARTYRATGNDLVATQRITGHASPLTTARYLETDAAELDRVVLSLAC